MPPRHVSSTQRDRWHAQQDGLLKSTKNWDDDRRRRLADTKDLPLVSRHDGKGASLKQVERQHELWQRIQEDIAKVDEQDKDAYVPLVILLRKLREGIFASHWSEGNVAFAAQAFELSATCSLKARDYDELWKSLKGLKEDLYTQYKSKRAPHYNALHLLYQTCYANHTIPPTSLRQKSDAPEMELAQQIADCIFQRNPMRFFRLYDKACPEFQCLMDHQTENMRRLAIDMMSKVYYSISLDWASHWMGISPTKAIDTIQRLRPDCLDKVNPDNTLTFVRRKRS